MTLVRSTPRRTPRARAAHQALSRFFRGQLPEWAVLRLVAPAAYVSFVGGALLALLALPRDFDTGRGVISRLCSRVHNPSGHVYLAAGLALTALFLAPLAAWVARTLGGCPRLLRAGGFSMRVGLVATSLVGVERAVCPTHGSLYEWLHLILAGVAFLGLWLGLALTIGALPRARGEAVAWQWLMRPPWYLSACVLPIVIVFLMYFPVNVLPQLRVQLLQELPAGLVFLRTPTFWQWYLVAGLNLSFAAATLRARRHLLGRTTTPAGWRIDPAQEAHGPHQGAPVQHAHAVAQAA
jgi:hypothetical protein